MAFGSFNWSKSAMRSNYENMMLLDRKDQDNRPIMKGYQAEFEAFWNNDDAALMYGEAPKKKIACMPTFSRHGLVYTPLTSAPVGDDFDDVEYISEDLNALST